MTTNQNRIQAPPHMHIKIVITVDPNTNQSEMKIERGKITNLQLAAMLNEHATAIMRRLVLAEAGLLSNPLNAQLVPPTGDNNDTA